MEEIIMARGVRHSSIPAVPAMRFQRNTKEQVAQEACAASNAFFLLFIHADTGGRNVKSTMEARSVAYCEAMRNLCNWPPARCVAISPEHETEAWILADSNAVLSALGYHGLPGSIGLPSNAREAERLVDPKAALEAAAYTVRGRRRRVDVKQLLPAIAARQSLANLRQAKSFTTFEDRLCSALADLGCI